MKYNGKRLTIKGVLDEIALEKRYGRPDTVQLRMKADGSFSIASVRVDLIPQADQVAAAIKLKKGDFASVTCTGEIEAIIGVRVSDCRLDSRSDAMAQPAIKIDAIATAMRFQTPDKDKIVAEYLGKRATTTIFIENFRNIDTGRRMFDANSGFFCDVPLSELASFPSKKGAYQVEGIFVVADDSPGLSRCSIAK